MINPDDFIITRKRKKYKFAKFANSSLCFELEQWKKQPADIVEVGAGTGLFLVELAARQPGKNFVCVDVKADRLQKGAYEAEARGLTNIRFLRARADQLAECFKAYSLETIWLTFSDPFPKDRSAGRRLTHPRFLTTYASLLKKTGTLNIKTDDPAFFEWSREQLEAEKWRIETESRDLHASALPDDYKVMTSYEERWTKEGKPTNFLQARKV